MGGCTHAGRTDRVAGAAADQQAASAGTDARPRAQAVQPVQPQLNVDPYPAYEQLRAKGRSCGTAALNNWIVSSFELCETVLRSPVSVDRGDLFDVVPPWSKLERRATGRPSPRRCCCVDPPDHTRLRRLVSRAFTPRTIERHRATGRRDRRGADRTRCATTGTVDLFEAVFAPLPIYVIGELLGIPERGLAAAQGLVGRVRQGHRPDRRVRPRGDGRDHRRDEGRPRRLDRPAHRATPATTCCPSSSRPRTRTAAVASAGRSSSR